MYLIITLEIYTGVLLISAGLQVTAILYTDRYPKQQDTNMLAAYDRTTNHYFLNRNNNLKDETWSRQMAEFMKRVIRPHMKVFLEKKGFFLK